MKTLLLILSGLLVTPIQKWSLQTLLTQVERHSPYRVQVDKVEGRLLSRFTLQHLRVGYKTQKEDFLEARSLVVEWDPWALRHRDLHLKGVRLIEPRIVWPEKHPASTEESKTTESSSWTVRVDQFNAEKADLRMNDWQLRDWAVSGAWQPEHWHLNADVPQQALPRERGYAEGFLKASGSPKALEQTQFSADLQWISKQRQPVLRLKGRMTQGAGTLEAESRVPGVGFTAEADVNIPKDAIKGHFDLAVSSMQSVATFYPGLDNARGQLNASGTFEGSLRRLRVAIQAQAKDAAWEEWAVKTIQADTRGTWPEVMSFSFNASASDLKKVHQENPWDVKELSLQLKPASNLWQTSAQVRFRNGHRVEEEGSLRLEGRSQLLQWTRIAFFPNRGKTLENKKPGRARRGANGSLEIQDLLLENDALTLNIPRANFHGPNTTLELNAELRDPSYITTMTRDVVFPDGGHAKVQLNAQGDGKRWKTQGQIEASFARLKIKPAGIDWRNLKVAGRIQDNAITLDGGVQTRKGKLQLKGKSQWPSIEATIEGDHIEFKTEQVQANVDVRLALGGTVTAPKITGELDLRSGTYTASEQKKKDTAEASPETDPSSAIGLWENTVMDVKVTWPDQVWYRDGLTKIETNGNLRVQKEAGHSVPYLTGQIGIVRGSYDAYGRDFILDSGNILFPGPPNLDPILNIRALYKAEAATVYLDVKGTASAPDPTLSSNPPLSEQDIISVLVIGRPMNQVQGDPNSNKSDQAQALATSILGSYLTQGLRKRGMDVLDLDVIRVEPTGQGQGNRLTLGRYIGSRLFVRYGQGLNANAGNVFNADYQLKPQLLLKGEIGTTNGGLMDLQYRYPLNERKKR